METNTPSTANAMSDADCGFAGTLKNIQLNDLIQMCCLSGSSLCMRVTKGNRQGTIFIVDGEIVHAACEEIAGEEAFYRILGWQTGSFESIEVDSPPPRTIEKNYHFLIMEAARRVDEGARVESSPPAPVVPPEASEDRLRVLVVDDSPMMRKILSSILTTSNQVNVVGMAGDGREAIRLIDELLPDLVILDVNMPVMDGSSTIKHIMIKKPCPVVIMSNPGDGSSRTIFNFLELGAVDFMGKPTKHQDILLQQKKIVERIKIAATARIGNFRITRLPTPAALKAIVNPPTTKACRGMTIVLSGPGGHPEQMRLLADLVPAMGAVNGCVVAFQGLPPTFSEPFAKYLMERCGVSASVIDARTTLLPGACYVGKSGAAMTVRQNVNGPDIDCVPGASDSPMDEFLMSAADAFGGQLAVVLLSGGHAGNLTGLQKVKATGGRIVLRSRESSLIPGPLDTVVEAGLNDAEVDFNHLLETVISGF